MKQLINYQKRKWLFLLLVLIFIMLNIWVWSSIFENEEENKPRGEFVGNNIRVLMKIN